MTANGADPHSILGVALDATEEEIKRAYRTLAKRHHPDADHGSVSRFLEIQGAYEALLGSQRPSPGAEWARRPRGGGARRAGARSGSRPAGEGSGRASGSRTAGSQPRGTPPGRASGDASSARQATADQARSRNGPGRRRATLGSTSYDDAEWTFEPDWGGASWYGPTSGTYWTLNPKEYADPRKHGPEYQARAARRTANGRPPSAERAHEARPPDDASWPGNAPAPDAARPTGSTTPASAPASRPAADGTARPTNPRPFAAPPVVAAAMLPDDTPRVVPRVVLAIAGWLPAGLALAAAAGLPGGLLATLPLQALGLAVLAFLPRAAWVAAGGGLAVVFGAIPIVAAVTALGGGFVPGGPAPLAAIVLAGVAWLVGASLAASGRVVAYPWRRGT